MNASTFPRPAFRRRPATLATFAGGLALAALTAIAPYAAAAGEDEPTGPHNEQVALVNETNEQPAETKSAINGTAQVTSYEGAYVVFSTPAALVPWDTNGTDDVYLRSRPDGTTVLVSGKGQRAGNEASFEPTISDDGRYVAYSTFATDLAQGTGGKALDVVVRDMQSRKTVLVSQTTKGEPGTRNSFFPVISGNGRHVSFQTFSRLGPKDGDRKEDVYVRDLKRGTTQQVSLLPGASRDVRGGGAQRRHQRQRPPGHLRQRRDAVGPRPQGRRDRPLPPGAQVVALLTLPDGQQRPAGDLRQRAVRRVQLVARPTSPATTPRPPTSSGSPWRPVRSSG